MRNRILAPIILAFSISLLSGPQAMAGGPSPTAQSGFRQTVDSWIASLFPTDEQRVRARYERAQSRAKAGEFNGAAHDYIWLWRNIPKLSTGYTGVRVSFMAGHMKDLAEAHPSCYRMFEALRNESTPYIAPGPNFDSAALWDWYVLNCQVLLDADAIAESVQTQNITAVIEGDTVDRVGDVRNIIIDRGDWELAARLISDPLDVAQYDRELYEQVRADLPQFMRYSPDRHDPDDAYEKGYRTEFARLHTLALIRGSDEDAKAIVAEAVKVQPADAMYIEIARTALSADQVRSMHQEWLNTCAVPPVGLCEQLETALTNPAPPQTPPPAPAPLR